MRIFYGLYSFNTQPPEGGWGQRRRAAAAYPRFNTQPPEGGWIQPMAFLPPFQCFNTQPPEGGWILQAFKMLFLSMFQHAAARRRLVNTQTYALLVGAVSTRSRPKAAGIPCTFEAVIRLFQHAAARRRLGYGRSSRQGDCWFQHAAARRRLVTLAVVLPSDVVFQHAAARRRLGSTGAHLHFEVRLFQHAAARRRLELRKG